MLSGMTTRGGFSALAVTVSGELDQAGRGSPLLARHCQGKQDFV